MVSAMSEGDIGDEFRREMEALMQELTESIPRVVGTIDSRRALARDAAAVMADFREPLPAEGCGAAATIERLIDLNEPACTHYAPMCRAGHAEIRINIFVARRTQRIRGNVAARHADIR